MAVECSCAKLYRESHWSNLHASYVYIYVISFGCILQIVQESCTRFTNLVWLAEQFSVTSMETMSPSNVLVLAATAQTSLLESELDTRPFISQSHNPWPVKRTTHKIHSLHPYWDCFIHSVTLSSEGRMTLWFPPLNWSNAQFILVVSRPTLASWRTMVYTVPDIWGPLTDFWCV